MRPLLNFDDAGATDDHPAKGVTVGDIRAWFDRIEQLEAALHRIGFEPLTRETFILIARAALAGKEG